MTRYYMMDLTVTKQLAVNIKVTQHSKGDKPLTENSLH